VGSKTKEGAATSDLPVAATVSCCSEGGTFYKHLEARIIQIRAFKCFLTQNVESRLGGKPLNLF
jgi:hypothetical protein